MHAIVTGAAGFIGSHLCNALLDAGWTVTGIDGFVAYYPREIKEGNLRPLRGRRGFHFIEADLGQLDWAPLLAGSDTVFHQAAQAGVRASWGDTFASYLYHNLQALQRLLDAVRQIEHKPRVIFASSSSLYGDAETLPTPESTIPLPVSPYGITKMAGERLGFVYHRSYAVPFTALRYFTVYGPRQRPDMAFHRFMRALRRGETIKVYGDGAQTRDFTFVSDIVAANLAAATSEAAIGEAFNIGGGARVSLHDVLATIERVSGRRFERLMLADQAGDARHTGADISKAQRLLGYHPTTDLETGLRAMWEWSEVLTR
jgi:nucleoside-diphosphate-sugar epimerase